MRIRDFAAFVSALCLVAGAAAAQGGPVKVGDVALAIVPQWYDTDGVDMVTDGGSSAVALAVEEISREKHKLVLFSGPGDQAFRHLDQGDCPLVKKAELK